MTSMLKLGIKTSFILLIGISSILAQSDVRVEAKPKDLPAPEYPKIAEQSGLAGKVSVLVEIDENGNVVSATDPEGPDWVCPAIARPDVVALREAAVTAAKNAKFEPATNNGVAVPTKLRLDYQIGERKPVKKETVLGATVIGSSDTVIGSKASVKDQGSRVDRLTVVGNSTYDGPQPNGSSAPVEGSKMISGGVLNGKALSLPKPTYPPAARAVRASGAVQMHILILEDGSVFSAEPAGGHPLLQAASRIAACSAVFSPTMLEGQPVKVSGIITYNFVP